MAYLRLPVMEDGILIQMPGLKMAQALPHTLHRYHMLILFSVPKLSNLT
jgi:hypothetical protein